MEALAITVLYEDQRGLRQGFGLHALVKACVFDAINGERHRVEGMMSDHRPMKGVQALLRSAARTRPHRGRRPLRGGRFDDDAIREQLELPHTATDAVVEREIRRGCNAPDRLAVIPAKAGARERKRSKLKK